MPLRRFDHMDDPGNGRILDKAGNFHFQGAVGVQRTGEHRRAGRFLRRQRFAGDGGLVDGAFAVQDVPIQGDFFAGTDDHNFANSDVFDRQIGFNAVSPHPGQFRSQIHELPDGTAGFLHRPAFQ